MFAESVKRERGIRVLLLVAAGADGLRAPAELVFESPRTLFPKRNRMASGVARLLRGDRLEPPIAGRAER